MLVAKTILFSGIEQIIKGFNPQTITDERKAVLQSLTEKVSSGQARNSYQFYLKPYTFISPQICTN